MRIIGVILLCMCLFSSTCFAETTQMDDEYLFGALENCQIWIEELNAGVESIKDEDSAFIVEKVRDELIFGQSLMVSFLTQDLEKAENDTSFEARYAKRLLEEQDGRTLIEVKTGVSEGVSGARYACEASYMEQYYQFILYTYDDNDELTGKRRIELAQKENEIILLLVAYDAQLDYISKFATRIQEDCAETVFIRVFGSQMNIALKPKEWLEGKLTIEDWNDDLLLPDTREETN